jgi:hypothetical protein
VRAHRHARDAAPLVNDLVGDVPRVGDKAV